MKDDIRQFTPLELAILVATQLSDTAQTAYQLAQRVEIYPILAQPTINGLVRRGVLEPIESDGHAIRYAYQANAFAQAAYEQLHTFLLSTASLPTLDNNYCRCGYVLRSSREREEQQCIECRLRDLNA
jgi:hypothetical protein